MHALNKGLRGVGALENGDGECRSFAGSVFGASQNVAAGQCDRDRLFLDGRGAFEPRFEDAHEQFTFQKVVFEFVSLDLCDILQETRA